jgi:hypothetical protein
MLTYGYAGPAGRGFVNAFGLWAQLVSWGGAMSSRLPMPESPNPLPAEALLRLSEGSLKGSLKALSRLS